MSNELGSSPHLLGKQLASERAQGLRPSRNELRVTSYELRVTINH
jgi:hypothetical protein